MIDEWPRHYLPTAEYGLAYVLLERAGIGEMCVWKDGASAMRGRWFNELAETMERDHKRITETEAVARLGPVYLRADEYGEYVVYRSVGPHVEVFLLAYPSKGWHEYAEWPGHTVDLAWFRVNCHEIPESEAAALVAVAKARGDSPPARLSAPDIFSATPFYKALGLAYEEMQDEP